jgi:hypothetical protein
MRTALGTIAALLLLATPANAQHTVSLSFNQGVVQPGTPPCPDGSTPTVQKNSLYRATASGKEVAPPVSVSKAPVTSFTDQPGGGTFFYTVTATDCMGESPMSAEVSVVVPATPILPAAPTGLMVTGVADNTSATPPIYSRSFQWNAVTVSGSPVVYYNIRREVTGTNAWKILNPSPLQFPSYFDDTEEKGTLYGYQVQAWTLKDGGGSWSATLFTGPTN